MIVNRLQSMRRARRRLASVTFYAQTFQKPARYFCYCPTGPGRSTGRGAPHGGCMCNIGTSALLCFGVSCGICAGAIVLTSCLSCLVMHGRRARGRTARRARGRTARRARGRTVAMPVCRGYAAAVVATAVFCRRRVVSTRRRMLVFPMVFTVSRYPGLHNQLIMCRVIAITG